MDDEVMGLEHAFLTDLPQSIKSLLYRRENSDLLKAYLDGYPDFSMRLLSWSPLQAEEKGICTEDSLFEHLSRLSRNNTIITSLHLIAYLCRMGFNHYDTDWRQVLASNPFAEYIRVYPIISHRRDSLIKGLQKTTTNPSTP